MATDKDMLTSFVPRWSWNSTLRPLCKRLRRRRQKKPVPPNPTELGSQSSGFAKDDIEHILQDSPTLVDQRPAIVEKEEPQHPDLGRFTKHYVDFESRGTWTEEKEKVILGPYDYLTAKPGKEFRTLLLNVVNAWLEVPPESLAIIIDAVRSLHAGSLLIDDIQDNSTLRRGQPVAHHIFGVAQTINSGNYAYFLALRDLHKLRNPAAAIEIYTTETMKLHHGQGMDLFWRDTLTCPTEDDYLEMSANKTGGLFRLGVKLMQLESPTSIDCMPLVHLLGLIFQIADDYKNLANSEYTLKKGYCEDFTEGKFSFPLIHSIRSDPANPQLLHTLAQKPTNVDVKRSAVAYLESTGSFEYTRRVVAVLISRAKQVADEIDQGRGISGRIHALLDELALE